MGRLSQVMRSRPLATIAAAVVISAVTAGAVVAAATPAIQTITPQKASQVTNIDVLRQQVKNYYGVPLAATGPNGTWAAPLNMDSNYAREAESVATSGEHWLAARAKAQAPSGIKAIVIDVDDTTLATWNYELYSNWDYNPTTNATFVNGGLFPAVPGMVEMASQATAEGYALIVITGRPVSQQPATLDNLASAGYPTPTLIFTKPPVASYPPYLTAACANDPGGSCTTDHYKAATRGYIESLGYEIVANFGDQYSDFSGGFEDATFKLPNPNYFLP